MKPALPLCLALSVTSLAACGPAVDHGATIGNEPGGAPAPAHASATPCPSEPTLTETARTAWNKGTGTITVSCVAVSVGGETLWYLDGSFEPEPNDDYMVGMWTSLVTPGGEVRWIEGDDDMPYSAIMNSYMGDLDAVDLDGDGNDEILYTAGYSHGGYEDASLTVMRVSADGVESLAGENIPLSSDNSAADPDPADLSTCDAQWALAEAPGGGKQIEIEYAGQCERTGKVVWRYDGKVLTEVK
jgi:hypothetical protein